MRRDSIYRRMVGRHVHLVKHQGKRNQAMNRLYTCHYQSHLLTACSSSNPCYRDPGTHSCRGCLHSGTLCNLPSMQVFQRTNEMRAHEQREAQVFHSHMQHIQQAVSSPTPEAHATQQQRLAPSALSHYHPPPYDISRHLSAAHPLSTSSVVPLSEVQDKYKLPPASKTPPPPDAPAYSPKGSPLRKPIPFNPKEPPTVHKLPVSATSTAVMSTAPVGPPLTRHIYVRNAVPRDHASNVLPQCLPRSHSDSHLIFPSRNTASHAPRTQPSTLGTWSAAMRQDGLFTSQQNLTPMNANPMREANRAGPFNPSQNVGRIVVHKDVSVASHQRWLSSTGNTDNATASRPVLKRARLSSPKEGSLPEDKRGITAKRPRKTIGPWTPRRPQTACNTCRVKK